jgi:transposase-like protein
MEVVPRRDANTLLPIIQAHTLPGTVIHSDQWRAYSQVTTLPNVASHSTVNHSLNFVDPVTGTHTQHVESYWNRVKTKFKRMKGCHEEKLTSYLDEFMWRERFGATAIAAFDSLIGDITSILCNVLPVIPSCKLL